MKNARTQKLFEAARLAEDAEDSEKALRLYQKALALDPASPHLQFSVACSFYDVGDWKAAILTARRLLKRHPRFHLAHSLIARSYVELGRGKLAERFYRQALAIKQRPETWVFLGDVLGRLGRDDEMKVCLRNALKVDPRYEEAHYNLGLIYRVEGKLALAEKHLRRAIEIDPDYALAYAELGQLLVGQKDKTKEATSLLRRALSYDSSDGWSVAYLANALWRLRKLKAADEQYRKLMELWPDASLSYWCYGGFLGYESKDRSTAERYLRRAVEIDPRDEEANYHLGKHLLYWNQKEDARGFLSKAARFGHRHACELLQGI